MLCVDKGFWNSATSRYEYKCGQMMQKIHCFIAYATLYGNPCKIIYERERELIALAHGDKDLMGI